VAVGGGDVSVAVQAQQADGQAAQRCHDAGRVAGPDQRFVLLVGHVPDPVKAVFYFSVAADPGGQGDRVGAAVAGDEADDLDGLLAVLRDRAAGPAAVVRAHGRDGRDGGPGQLLQLRYKVGMLPLTVIT
jgi:hypothetical protein